MVSVSKIGFCHIFAPETLPNPEAQTVEDCPRALSIEVSKAISSGINDSIVVVRVPAEAWHKGTSEVDLAALYSKSAVSK
jgi:hypothetical protein